MVLTAGVAEHVASRLLFVPSAPALSRRLYPTFQALSGNYLQRCSPTARSKQKNYGIHGILQRSSSASLMPSGSRKVFAGGFVLFGIEKRYQPKSARHLFYGNVVCSTNAAPQKESDSDVLERSEETKQEDDVTISIARPSRRQRVLAGSVVIGAPRQAVWDLLSEYDRLADFIPNLVGSSLLPRPEGGIRMEQIGLLSRKFGLKIKIVMDVDEHHPDRIDFRMVQSRDFVHFVGFWDFEEIDAESVPSQRGSSENLTILRYELDVIPRAYFPIGLVERKLMSDLPRNLFAIRDRAERAFKEDVQRQ